MKFRLFVLMTVASAIVASILAFKREYVISADGLLDLTVVTNNNETVTISGSLLSSGAKVVKTTRLRSGDEVLVRVYADAVRGDDNPRAPLGRFSALVPIDHDVHSIRIGDGAHTVTVGRIGNIAIRLPVSRNKVHASRVVWRRQ